MNNTTPEQEARAAEEDPAFLLYKDGRPKMHRHTFTPEVHLDSECWLGVSVDGTWHTSRRRVYVFDDDALDEHERIISARVFDEGMAEGRAYERGAETGNPYKSGAVDE